MYKNNITRLVIVFGLSLFSVIGNSGNGELVHETSIDIDKQSIPVVVNTEKFLNDLMLSPYWEVTRDRAGNYMARARNVYDKQGYNDFCRGEFLFSRHGGDEFASECHPLIMRKKSYFDFSIQIVFGHKSTDVDESIYTGGDKARLGIFVFSFMKGRNGSTLDNNAYSTMLIPLNKSGIILKLREQGKDNNRNQTKTILHGIFDEIRRINELPARYYVSKIYSGYFKYEFGDLGNLTGLKRTKGIQDRDTFSGYLTYKKGDQYSGVDIRVLSDKYCVNGICTRSESSNAEYLGKPYFDSDKVYYQFRDTAVYLNDQYDKEFGTFTGKNSFKADIEIYNAENTVLYKSTGFFKGWQR